MPARHATVINHVLILSSTVVSVWRVFKGGEGLEQALQMEKQLLELHQQNEALRQAKQDMEKRLRAEIERLQDQVQHCTKQSR